MVEMLMARNGKTGGRLHLYTTSLSLAARDKCELPPYDDKTNSGFPRYNKLAMGIEWERIEAVSKAC